MGIRLAVAQLISCGKLLTFALHLATVVPMRISAALMAISVVVLVGVAGCTPETPPVLPAPESSTTPLFASEEEALAAAEEAYSAYLSVVDAIFVDGGENPERLGAVASATLVEKESESYAELRASGIVGSGSRTFDSVSLQTVDLTASNGWVATVYLCQDYSHTDLVDSNGQSLIQGERRTRFPLEVAFSGSDSSPSRLLVSEVVDWTGRDFCAE